MRSIQGLHVVHLVAWGQLGVLVRYYMGRVFGGACSNSTWVPCVTSPGLIRSGGALFTDLPANILGCFIMGLLSPSDLLQMNYEEASIDICADAATVSPSPKALIQESDKASETHLINEAQPYVHSRGTCKHAVNHTACSALPMDVAVHTDNQELVHRSHRTTSSGQVVPQSDSTACPHSTIESSAAHARQVVQVKADTCTLTAVSKPAVVQCSLLPSTSCLQDNASLMLGLRTGLCGCLTTFASWMAQMVGMMVGAAAGQPPLTRHPTEWPAALSSIVLGCLASQSALVAGQQCARAASGMWARRSVRSRLHVSRELDVPPRSKGVENDGVDGVDGGGHRRCPASTHTIDVSATSLQAAHHNAHQGESSVSGLMKKLPDAVAVMVMLVLTGISAGFIGGIVGKGREAAQLTDLLLWISILMCPIGCLTRWQLSSLNQTQSQLWTWFPLGTWLANMAACLLDFAMIAILIRTHASLSTHHFDAIAAIILGVGGSLSTVSTWVVELQKLGYKIRNNHHAVLYLVLTIAPAVSSGVIIVGSAAWTT